MTPHETTLEELAEALRFLRDGWDGDNSERAIEAFTKLDKAGVYDFIDEETAR